MEFKASLLVLLVIGHLVQLYSAAVVALSLILLFALALGSCWRKQASEPAVATPDMVRKGDGLLATKPKLGQAKKVV